MGRWALAPLLALALVACGDDDHAKPGATPTPTVTAESRRYLFLLYSDRGELVAQSDGSYVFRLHDVWNTVVAFADRPFRDATATPLRAFIDRWEANGFADQPPNAAVTMLVEGSVQVTDWAILTLTEPRLDGGTLEFDARFLTLPNGEPAFFPTVPGSPVKASFTTTQVFLDSVAGFDPTPTIRACAGDELDECAACVTGGGGCCTLSSPGGCFDPGAAPNAQGWIGFTLCNQQRDRACLIGVVPTPTPPAAGTATATPTAVGPQPTATNTPTGPVPTPTHTVAPGTIRRCGPADLGGKVCEKKPDMHCSSDGACGNAGPCVPNVGGCLRDCKGKYCCTASGGCFDPDDPSTCSFTGNFPDGCNNPSDNTCRDDVVCDARDVPASGVHKITIENATAQTIWVGGIAGTPAGPIDVGDWDWELAAGASHTISVPFGWDSGRLWPRTGCVEKDGKFTCDTGDCNGARTCATSGQPPAILAELTLDGGANPGQPDNYDASAVDGWNNIVVTVEPVLSGNFPGLWCGVAGCTGTPECPAGYMAKYSAHGQVVGCISPCKSPEAQADPDLALKLCCTCSTTDEGCSCDSAGSCCDDKFGCSPFYPSDQPKPANRLCIPTGTVTRPDGTQLSRPESKWDDAYLAYIDNFHAACPRTYAWQFDDLDNLLKCEGTPGTLLDYKVTFHPAIVQ